MSQPSLTIKAFLQQAEDGLALLRTKATPRKKAMAEGSASVQVSRLLRESGQEDAKDQLELQARTMLALDRRLRGFDARFKALEKAIASAAELAAESSRCGRDGMEAATAAAAAVRVEAEAKCRDLSKRIDSLSAPSREDAERVQQWLGEDVESIERRLRSQLEQRADEVLQASQCIAAELKAEVQMELASFREDLSFRSRPPGVGESAWERLLISTKEDLRRAVHGVADLESRVQGEERVYWSVVQSLEQRVGSLEASSNQMLDDRMGKLEAQIARLDRTPGARPQPTGSVVQDPAVKRPRGMLASMALAEMPQVELTQMTPRVQEPERLRVQHVERVEAHEGKIEASEVVSPPLPASPASSSAPSPHLRGVPLQPPGRPSRLMRGSLRPSSEPEDAGKFGRTARPSDTEPMRPSAQTSHEASQAAPSLVAEAQTMSVPIEQGGRADSSGSSSPTFSDSANLSQLLRSTSAMERSEGPSSGSRSPMITVTQPQARHSSGRGAQEADAENEPVCAFSTNVSDEGFRSGDDLMLR